MQRNVLKSALMDQGYCKEANKSYKILKKLFIILEVGRKFWPCRKLLITGTTTLMARSDMNSKFGAVITWSNIVFCLLHETTKKNHRLIKKVCDGMDLWTSSGSTFCEVRWAISGY